MVEQQEVVKKRLRLVDMTFSSEEVYKTIRKESDSLHYFFIEKEHELKPSKYGHERKFVFSMIRPIDNFARTEMLIELNFENLNKVKQNGKEIDKGDVTLTITSNVYLDYRNEWWMSKFNRKLFKFYLKYFVKEKIKKLYLKTLTEETEKIYNIIKEKLEYYH